MRKSIHWTTWPKMHWTIKMKCIEPPPARTQDYDQLIIAINDSLSSNYILQREDLQETWVDRHFITKLSLAQNESSDESIVASLIFVVVRRNVLFENSMKKINLNCLKKINRFESKFVAFGSWKINRKLHINPLRTERRRGKLQMAWPAIDSKGVHGLCRAKANFESNKHSANITRSSIFE